MLRYDGATFDSSQCSNTLHAKFMERLFDIHIAVNDCSVNEFIFTLYEAGMLSLPVKSAKLDTSLVGLLVGPDLVRQFGSHQPCELTLTPRELPQFTKNYASKDYSEDNYWELATPLAIDIKCVNSTAESDEYMQATTLLMDFSTKFNMNITYQINVGFEIYDLSLKYTADEDSHVNV